MLVQATSTQTEASILTARNTKTISTEVYPQGPAKGTTEGRSSCLHRRFEETEYLRYGTTDNGTRGQLHISNANQEKVRRIVQWNHENLNVSMKLPVTRPSNGLIY